MDKLLKQQKENNSSVDWEDLEQTEQFTPKCACGTVITNHYFTECLKCWGKNKDNQKRMEISRGQSWNLAVAMCAEWFSITKFPAENQMETLENWQRYFLAKLLEPYQPKVEDKK